MGGKVWNLDPRVSQLVCMALPVFMPLVSAKRPTCLYGSGFSWPRGLDSPCPPPRLLRPLHPQDPLAPIPRGAG